MKTIGFKLPEDTWRSLKFHFLDTGQTWQSYLSALVEKEMKEREETQEAS